MKSIFLNGYKEKRTLLRLTYNLTSHCNLNCIGCDNFSPLANEEFQNFEYFKEDLIRISFLTMNRIELLQLTGGEPLLHPQVNDFIETSRKCFPLSIIELVTNGILLNRMPGSFYDSCKYNKITVVVTKYPINIDHDEIKNLLLDRGINFKFYGDTDQVEKTMHCIPLDTKGKQQNKNSFNKCYKSNLCIKCKNGKLFTCSLIPNIHYFNEYFNLDLRISKKDFIDIYKVKSIDKVFDNLRKPIPFCRYCNIDGSRYNIKWDTSKKKITEWT